MASRRNANLAAAQAASLVHDKYDAKNRLVRKLGGIDVYQLAEDLDLPVMFKKLSGLLGVYLHSDSPGIAITTERPPSVQRFTCAHEIGHHCLQHATTYDTDQEIERSWGGSQVDPKEIEANVFAANLLLPNWLLSERARDLMKIGLRLPDPVAAYQLSLRLGCSYQALVRTLGDRGLITTAHQRELSGKAVKSIKESILRGYETHDWHRDIWLLTSDDNDEELETLQSDMLVLRVNELSSAGYVAEVRSTNVDSLAAGASWHIAEPDAARPVGGATDCFAAARATSIGKAAVQIIQRRPWEADGAAILSMSVDVSVQAPEANLSRASMANRLQTAGTLK